MQQDNRDNGSNRDSMISLSFIIRELGDDPNVIQEMLITFREVLIEFDLTISKGNEQTDSHCLKTALHKIKPSVRMFNLSELLKKIDDLDEKLKNEAEPIYIQSKVSDIRRMIPLIITEIDHYVLKLRQ